MVIRGEHNEKLCIYLSSHAGCNLGCGQCHLTANQQTSMKPATPKDYNAQFIQVLQELESRNAHLIPNLKRVNIEFMSRGDPLMNPWILKHWNQLHEHLLVSKQLIDFLPWFPKLERKYNISTIVPHTFRNRSLYDVFLKNTSNEYWPTIYYSAWSLNSKFKEKWMPRALPTEEGISKLVDYQQTVKKHAEWIPHLISGHGSVNPQFLAQSKVVIHGALVEGQNDSISDIQQLVETMTRKGLYARFNLIRYNPPQKGPFQQFKESPETQRHKIFDWLARNNPGGVKKIDRVGSDVYASCGTFVPF